MNYKALSNPEEDKWGTQVQGKLAVKVGLLNYDAPYAFVSGTPEGYLDDKNFKKSKMLWENILRENPDQTSMKLKELEKFL
jgi:hypothetical protein